MKYDTPRLKAKAKGKKRYEGLPCKYGHGNTRYVCNQGCVECRRLKKNALRRKKNPPQKRGRKVIERTPEYLEHVINSRKLYQKVYWNKPENIGKRRAKKAKRRASKIQRTPKWLTQEDFNIIKKIYADATQRSIDTGIQWHVDHIYPLRGEYVSGLHVPSNLQIIPAVDNLKKSNKLLDSFRVEVINL